VSWGLLFRLRQQLKGSLWFFPLTGAVAGLLLAMLDRQIEGSVTLPGTWQYSSSVASTLLTTIVGATVALTGFVVTVSVLAIQMATGTFSARYMRIWYRDHMLKAVLAVLIGTVTFSFSLLRGVSSSDVHNLGVTVAGLLLVLSLVLFVFFLDRFTHRLRPVAVARLVARVGRKVVTSAGHATEAATAQPGNSDRDLVLVVQSRRPGSIQAIDIRGMVAWAAQHDCRLEAHRAVGDFVATDQRVIDVFGSAPPPATTDRRLRRMIALGIERTVDQDPAFAIRVMVDVAIRALSAAINDPTTAVQVLDHLEDLLQLIGSTPLHGRQAFADKSGVPRLVLPGRMWEDYLALAVTEIREYGSGAIQVMRRLRAMLEDLQEAVRPEHRPAVTAELARLSATVAASFGGSVDQDQAQVRDRQGIGGPREGVPSQAMPIQTGSPQ
jgi:uncharacterized membrane protein